MQASLGKDPGHFGIDGSTQQPALVVMWRKTSESDDQCILACESSDEGLVVIVVDFGNLQAYRDGAFAVVTADGDDFVLSAGHKSLCYVSAAVPASLSK
jgi:hypothetical protein